MLHIERLARRARREIEQIVTGPLRSYVSAGDAFAILDDSFPYVESGFRYFEYMQHLSGYHGTIVYSWPSDVGTWLSRLRDYKKEHTNALRISRFSPKYSAIPKAAYFTFLFNAEKFEPWLTKNRVPFIMQLYPGGCFHVGESKTKQVLLRVSGSPAFRGIITTQKNATRYLKEELMLTSDLVHEIYGVTYVPPIDLSDIIKLRNKRAFSKAGDKLVVGFAANRYTKDGLDKGFDVFCRTASLLSDIDNITFICVGPWRAADAPMGLNLDKVQFLPSCYPDALFELLLNTDILLNPVRSNIISPGAFDGFPTTVGVMAALAGCALFTTDPENNNLNRYVNGQDLVIIREYDASTWADAVMRVYRDRNYLNRISRCGAQSFRKFFNHEYQIRSRWELFRQLLKINFAHVDAH